MYFFKDLLVILIFINIYKKKIVKERNMFLYVKYYYSNTVSVNCMITTCGGKSYRQECTITIIYKVVYY